MLTQITLDLTLAHRNEDHLNTFPTRELHRGHEVAVTGHEDDSVHDSLACEPGHIKADLHINPFLAQCGNQVVLRHRSGPLDQVSCGGLTEGPTVE